MASVAMTPNFKKIIADQAATDKAAMESYIDGKTTETKSLVTSKASETQTLVTSKTNETKSHVTSKVSATDSELALVKASVVNETNEIDTKLGQMTAVNGGLDNTATAVNQNTNTKVAAAKEETKTHVTSEVNATETAINGHITQKSSELELHTTNRTADVKSYIYSRYKNLRDQIAASPSPAKDPKTLSAVVVEGSILGALNNTTFENLDSHASAYSRVRNGDIKMSPNNFGTTTAKQTVLNVTGGGWFYGAISRQMNAAGTVTWTLTVDGVETVLKTRSTASGTRHIIGRLLKYHNGNFLVADLSEQTEAIRFDSSFKLEMQHSTAGAESFYKKHCYYRYERD